MMFMSGSPGGAGNMTPTSTNTLWKMSASLCSNAVSCCGNVKKRSWMYLTQLFHAPSMLAYTMTVSFLYIQIHSGTKDYQCFFPDRVIKDKVSKEAPSTADLKLDLWKADPNDPSRLEVMGEKAGLRLKPLYVSIFIYITKMFQITIMSQTPGPEIENPFAFPGSSARPGGARP